MKRYFYTFLLMSIYVAISQAQDVQATLKAAHGYGVFTYGMYAYSQAKADHAMASFSLAIQEDPSLGRAHFHRGDLLFEQGDFKAAQQAYLSAIAIEPDYIYAYYNLACALARSGDNAKALECIENAFRHGYDRYDKISKDSDLAGLTNTNEFKKLVEEFRGKSAKQAIVAEFLLGTPEEKIETIKRLLNSDNTNWEGIAKKALTDSSCEVRIFGLMLYERFGGDGRIGILVRSLYDNNGYVNKYAGNALVKIGSPAIPYIDAILASEYEEAKFYARQIKNKIAPTASN